MIAGKRLNLSYKNVMLCLKFKDNNDIQNALLSINYKGKYDKDLIVKIFNELYAQRFTSDDSGQNWDSSITEEEKKEWYRKNKKFCHFGDFDLIYALFLERYGINLIDDYNISWFEYKMLLENLLEEKNNSLRERIAHRNFKPKNGKGYEQYNKNGEALKKTYSY